MIVFCVTGVPGETDSLNVCGKSVSLTERLCPILGAKQAEIMPNSWDKTRVYFTQYMGIIKSEKNSKKT
jgi:hypothetical protein